MKKWILCGALLLLNAPSFAQGELEQLLAARPLLNEKLTLDSAVQIALRESPIVRGAVEEVEAAAGRLNEARAEKRPMVSLNGFLSGGSISNHIESPVRPDMIMGLPSGAFADGNLMAMFPLYTSNRLESQVRQAAALRGASQAELQVQQQEAALLTRLAYREILARRALVDVAQNRLQEAEEQLRIDRVRAEEGKIPPFYVQRDLAEVAEAKQQVTNATRDVELSLVQLKTVMGIHPASQLEIVETLAYEPSAEWLPQIATETGTSLVSAPDPINALPKAFSMSEALPSLLRVAEKQRPELQAAQSRIGAAQAQSATIKNAYRPQVNAFVMGDTFKNRGNSAGAGVTYGIVASLSLFDGGAKNARLQTANAEKRKQEQEREKIALQVAQEVESALLNLRAAEQNIATAQTALVAAQEDYRVARLRYEAGKSIVVEVLDAQAARVRAESNVVQARYAYNVARDQLLRAVGALPQSVL